MFFISKKSGLKLVFKIVILIVFLIMVFDNQELEINGLQADLLKREEAEVVRVIDGDTIEVLINGIKEKVRLIGVNTPETIDPRRGVECFGKEASSFSKKTLSGSKIQLEFDYSQGNRDKYNRLLRYVFLENGENFNRRLILDGYAFEYVYKLPYFYKEDFELAQKQARSAGVGLWNEKSCRH